MYTGLTAALIIEEVLGDGIYSRLIGYISGWSIEDTAEVTETTKIGQAHKDAYVGYQSWSASAEGVVVFEKDTINGQGELFNKKRRGEKIKLNFYLDTVENTYLSGSGYIESLSIDISSESAAKISISVKGVGPLDLFINKENIIDKDSELFFKFKIDDNDDLLVETDGINDYQFEKYGDSYFDSEGYFKVRIGRKQQITQGV